MILVGTTLAAFVMDQEETWGGWLAGAEELRAVAQSSGEEVCFFAALEVDARGIEPFNPLLERLFALGGTYYSYSLDDKRTEVTSGNRILHIVTGRNIVTEYAVGMSEVSHVLFLDADTAVPVDTIPKLLEMNHALVGGEVPTYCLSGPKVARYSFPVQEHMNTAGFLMVRRDLFVKMRWRTDPDANLTDDPCWHHDALNLHGVPTYVRKDLIGRHFPDSIGSIETRGHKNMSVLRP